MTKKPTPPSLGAADQPQAAFFEDMRKQVQPVNKLVAKADHVVQEILDPEASSSMSIPLALAQHWVCQWLIDALQTRTATYVDAVSCRDRRDIDSVFYSAVEKRWGALAERIREQPGYSSSDVSPPKTFADVQRLVKTLDEQFPITKGGFSNTLGPTLRSLESQSRQPGSMSEEDRQRFIVTLGLPSDLALWRELVVNADLVSAIDQLVDAVACPPETAEPDHPVYRMRTGYAGRHAEQKWSTIATSPVLSHSVTLRLCEAERLYLVHSVDRLVPTNRGYWSTHAAVLAALGGLRPRVDLPGLSESSTFDWIMDWHRLPTSMSNTPGPKRESLAHRALPLPPQLGFDAMAHTWMIYHASRINVSEARNLCRALYDESDTAVSHVVVTYDGLQLLIEALFNRLIAVQVPMAEVTLATSLLRKTGLPWLPPAGSSLALHRPAVAAYAVLSAAGMVPDDTTYWKATGSIPV